MADQVVRPAVYEHPWAVRFCHWANAVSMLVLAMSGFQILNAFPSFGAKIPETDLIEQVPKAIRLGGWLGGALQWHLTFMWIFAATAALYVTSQIISGHFRTVLFRLRDVPGVWPMVRYYFVFGPRPRATGHVQRPSETRLHEYRLGSARCRSSRGWSCTSRCSSQPSAGCSADITRPGCCTSSRCAVFWRSSLVI